MNKLLIYVICAGLFLAALAVWLIMWKLRGPEPVAYYVLLLAGCLGAACGGSGMILIICWERSLK